MAWQGLFVALQWLFGYMPSVFWRCGLLNLPFTVASAKSRLSSGRKKACFQTVIQHTLCVTCRDRTAHMSRFQKLKDFERRFDTMGVDELKHWQTYWTQHAQGLAPKVRKQAMKRVYDIEKAIQQKSQRDRDAD
jgi:hypothetical protein